MWYKTMTEWFRKASCFHEYISTTFMPLVQGGVGIDTHGYSWIPIFLDTWQIFGIQVSKYPKKTCFYATLGTHKGRGLGVNSLLL